jgi:hypothetical protein
MALISEQGPEGRTLQFARDGLAFQPVASFNGEFPRAPGSFRTDDFSDASKQEQGISWGISMFYGTQQIWPYLLKYEIKPD